MYTGMSDLEPHLIIVGCNHLGLGCFTARSSGFSLRPIPLRGLLLPHQVHEVILLLSVRCLSFPLSLEAIVDPAPCARVL